MKDFVSGFNPAADAAAAALSIVDVRGNKHSTVQLAVETATGRSNDNNVNKCENAVDPLAVEEKFRIDRKKLEAMLQQGGNDANESAETFFQRIMYETKATIIWPSKLKIGAKSKKDPHVKVLGRPDQVRLAKEKIMANLDRSRITLKIDVAYPDHSHIIGKKGANIQDIMALTRCQIHFPDSNRNSTTEKSNQVSISGLPSDVEEARIMIRQYLPLTFTFDIPISSALYTTPVELMAFINDVKRQYGIAVVVKPQHTAFHRMSGSNRATVVVRGSEKIAANVIRGAKVILEYIFGSSQTDDDTLVSVVMDIAPHHHNVVKSHCQTLDRLTGTQIIFPNPDSRLPSIEKSPVRIIGTVDGVYKARAAILKFLPAFISFDLPEDHVLCRYVSPAETSSNGIQVNVKPNKQRDGKVSVIIKGIEGDISEMYKVRESIAHPDGDGLDLPKPNSSTVALPWSISGFDNKMPLTLTNGSSTRDIAMNDYGIALPSDMKRTSGGWNTNTGPIPAIQPLISGHFYDPSIYSRLNPCSSLQIGSDPCCYSGPSSTTSSLSSPGQSPRFGTPIEFSHLTTISENALSFCHNDSVSIVDLMGRLRTDLPRTSTPAFMSSEASASSMKSDAKTLNGNLTSNSLFDEKLIIQPIDLDETLTNFPDDYEKKRRLATRAMQKRIDEPEVRVPTDSWFGCGFSASMPPVESWTALDTLKFEENGNPSTGVFAENAAKKNCQLDLTCSNYIESTSLSLTASTISESKNMNDVLTVLGLLKYADVFHKQEIDLQTFATLNESDLRELGLTKLGPRRKLLGAIALLNGKATTSPAPGAERKLSGW